MLQKEKMDQAAEGGEMKTDHDLILKIVPQKIFNATQILCWHDGKLMQLWKDMYSEEIDWRPVPDSKDKDFPYTEKPK